MFSKKKIKENVESVQEQSREVGSKVCDGLSEAADTSCTYLKKNPWAGVGLGAALGLVVGLLISKK